MLAGTAPVTLDVSYIVDNNGKFKTIPADPRAYWEIYDYGTGRVRVER